MLRWRLNSRHQEEASIVSLSKTESEVTWRYGDLIQTTGRVKFEPERLTEKLCDNNCCVVLVISVSDHYSEVKLARPSETNNYGLPNNPAAVSEFKSILNRERYCL